MYEYGRTYVSMQLSTHMKWKLCLRKQAFEPMWNQEKEILQIHISNHKYIWIVFSIYHSKIENIRDKFVQYFSIFKKQAFLTLIFRPSQLQISHSKLNEFYQIRNMLQIRTQNLFEEQKCVCVSLGNITYFGDMYIATGNCYRWYLSFISSESIC